MAGHEEARNNIGLLELEQFNNTDRAVKHWIISASAGSYNAMNALRSCFENDIGIDILSLCCPICFLLATWCEMI